MIKLNANKKYLLVDLKKYKKILIIRLSSLGDILLTTPLIRSLAAQYPNIEIDFLIRQEYVDTVRYNPNISDLILIDREYVSKKIRKKIATNGYDLIIDLQNNLRSRRLTVRLPVKIVRYKKPYLLRFLLVKFKINLYEEIKPIPVRYAESIPGFDLDEKGCELFVPNDVPININKNDTYIGFCPGSKHRTKMWPIENFIQLGKYLNNSGYTVLLFGGRDDQDICSSISNELENAIDLSNDNNLLELGQYMRLCKTIICNDSGLMHTAVAVEIPVISIFGSTVKEFGFFPYGGKNLVLEDNSLSCRPCSHIGRDNCPKGHLKCLKNIDPNYVFNEVNNFINSL